MGADAMVKESLDEAMVRDGAAMVEGLDAAGRRVSAAFWFYFADANAWRLLLASPDVASKGPREFYLAAQKVLSTIQRGDLAIALDDIAVVPTDNPLVGLLRGMISTGAGISRIRFSKNVINGTFIEDALIYRLS